MKFVIPKTISEEELIKVLNVTKDKKIRLAFALGFYECMRVSEVVNLTPNNIDRNLKLIEIKQSKGSKDRNIPIAPEVMKGLNHLPITCSIRTLQRQFKKMCIEVLKKDCHFHTLRHSGITHYLVKKRWSSLEVQRMAGHSKITTTQIYTHINPTDLVDRMWSNTTS